MSTLETLLHLALQTGKITSGISMPTNIEVLDMVLHSVTHGSMNTNLKHLNGVKMDSSLDMEWEA